MGQGRSLPRGDPIWHCSRWGLPCHPCCQRRGGLLPHRFTLTTPNPGPLRPPGRGGLFLWRYPSGHPARALPGTVALGSPDFPRKGQALSAAVQPSAPCPPNAPGNPRQGRSNLGHSPPPFNQSTPENSQPEVRLCQRDQVLCNQGARSPGTISKPNGSQQGRCIDRCRVP